MTQLWVVQSNLLREESTRFLAESFQKLGINWAAFPLLPFVGTVPRFGWDGPVVYYGSTKLVRMAWERTLAPSGEDDPSLDTARLFYSPTTHRASYYGPRLGETWLNHGAEIVPVRDVVKRYGSDEVFFCRPDSGLKTFAGCCDTLRNICDTLDVARQNRGLDGNDLVVLNRPVEIFAEYRTWIIDGVVAAVVGYKRQGKATPWHATETEHDVVAEFAAAQWSKLSDLEAFVLDVATTPNGPRVVEINDIHASGFYLTEHIIDVVRDLSNYVAKYPEKKTNDD